MIENIFYAVIFLLFIQLFSYNDERLALMLYYNSNEKGLVMWMFPLHTTLTHTHSIRKEDYFRYMYVYVFFLGFVVSLHLSLRSQETLYQFS